MEKNDPHTESDVSLMDKIAADPEIINRSVTDTGQAPVVVTPVSSATVVGTSGAFLAQSDKMGNNMTPPVLNLLKPADDGGLAAKPVAAHKANLWPVFVVVGVTVVGLSGVGYMWYLNQAAEPVAQAPATPMPTATASPTPSVTPEPAAPSPSPSLPPVPQEVTAPAVTPTADHPQAVTVTSKSGLWLRSTPNSSNKSNIIGWLPNGAQVSVDQIGDFWWHGTYGGKTGYFAVNYTR